MKPRHRKEAANCNTWFTRCVTNNKSKMWVGNRKLGRGLAGCPFRAESHLAAIFSAQIKQQYLHYPLEYIIRLNEKKFMIKREWCIDKFTFKNKQTERQNFKIVKGVMTNT